MVAEYSNDLKKRARNLEPAIAPLIAAKELDDLTRLLPGPVSALAFLGRMISAAGGEQQLRIDSAINNCPVDWRNTVAVSMPPEIADFCPLHFLLAKSVETSGDRDWFPASRATGIDPEATVAAEDLAQQFYSERQLIRAYGAAIK